MTSSRARALRWPNIPHPEQSEAPAGSEGPEYPSRRARRDRSSNAASDRPRLRLDPHRMLAPLFWAWFRVRTDEECEWRYPADAAEVRVGGADPLWVLVIGDGPAAGCGVLTHKLGLAGHLARDLAERTSRGAVVRVAAEPAASARSTLRRVCAMNLDGYDAIVLMLATTDAFCLTPRGQWKRSLAGIVQALRATDAASVFVTSTARMEVSRWLSPFARRLTGIHAQTLDTESARVCEESGTPFLALDAASTLAPRTYAMWGRRLGAHIADSLAAPSAAGAFSG